jgi:hypothetical protein
VFRTEKTRIRFFSSDARVACNPLLRHYDCTGDVRVGATRRHPSPSVVTWRSHIYNLRRRAVAWLPKVATEGGQPGTRLRSAQRFVLSFVPHFLFMVPFVAGLAAPSSVVSPAGGRTCASHGRYFWLHPASSSQFSFAQVSGCVIRT